MIELVINAPHLQTWKQRLSAIVLNISGWLLWCYLLLPLLSLGCWFLEYGECSQWVNLSGGYPNLEKMLLLYLKTVTTMIVAWLAWVVYNITKRRQRKLRPTQAVTLADLCLAFNVTRHELNECQESRFAVVHFDNSGHIIGLEKSRLED